MIIEFNWSSLKNSISVPLKFLVLLREIASLVKQKGVYGSVFVGAFIYLYPGCLTVRSLCVALSRIGEKLAIKEWNSELLNDLHCVCSDDVFFCPRKMACTVFCLCFAPN